LLDAALKLVEQMASKDRSQSSQAKDQRLLELLLSGIAADSKN